MTAEQRGQPVPLTVQGYIGVVNGEPVFEKCSDTEGECQRVEIYNDEQDALARWAHVRRVTITVWSEPLERDPSWGRLT